MKNPTDMSSTVGQELQRQWLQSQTRRHFLQTCTTGLGAFFLGTAAQKAHGAAEHGGRLSFQRAAAQPLAPLPPQFARKARRVIYLHMAGAPSHLELFDHKPVL